MEFVSKEPVPELRILSMQVTQHPYEMTIFDLSFRQRLLHPLVVRLL